MSKSFPMQLCKPLQFILDAELLAGNEICGTDENAWSESDYVVYLKQPFHRDYAAEIKDADVRFSENRDSHYSVGEIYSLPSARHAVEAPFKQTDS